MHSYLNNTNIDLAIRAATICKADLASELVNEFPELQGTIGKYYELAHNGNALIAQAIEEHWMPCGEKKPLPKSEIGVLLSLADKIDNLLCFFSIGLKPSSSSDPYALRRQAIGLIKILIEHKHFISLVDVLKKCFVFLKKQYKKKNSSIDKDSVIHEIEIFIQHRIKTVFQEYGFYKKEIEASLSSGFKDIYKTFCKVKALALQ